MCSSEIELKEYESDYDTLNAMNTELGVVFPPGRMNTRAVQNILNNLPWKIPKNDEEWNDWTESMKAHIKIELGQGATDEEIDN